MADLELEVTELSPEEIKNMKVTDLKKRLKTLGLAVTGNKNELMERLQEACFPSKGNDSSFENSLNFDASQISGLESADDNEALEEENALLDQDQFSSYLNSSLEDNPKQLHSVENNSSSNSVIVLPKKRTSNTEEVSGKKIVLKRTRVIDPDFDYEEKKNESKLVTVNSDKTKSKLVTFTSEDNDSEDKIKLSLKSMSEAERLAMRAKRFNLNDSEIKTTASLRSLKSTNAKNSKQSIISSSTAPDLDKLKKRAERFGQVVSTVMKQLEEKEKLLKRKSKFGDSLGASVTSVDDQAKKRKRAERFGL